MNELLVNIPDPPMRPPNPMTLVQTAIEKGMQVDQLGKLFDLIERERTDLARRAFVVAMTDFKQNPPEILKTKTVSYGNTNFKHAELGPASVAIAQALGKHGLSHRWETRQLDGGAIEVTCVISHEDGHSERSTLRSGPDTSGGKNAIQAIASAVSYLERYTLFAATGLSAQEDDDGAGAADASTITPEQGEELRGLMTAKQVDADAFFGWASEAAKQEIKRLGEIPAAMFPKCVDRLKKARRQG